MFLRLFLFDQLIFLRVLFLLLHDVIERHCRLLDLFSFLLLLLPLLSFDNLGEVRSHDDAALVGWCYLLLLFFGLLALLVWFLLRWLLLYLLGGLLLGWWFSCLLGGLLGRLGVSFLCFLLLGLLFLLFRNLLESLL